MRTFASSLIVILVLIAVIFGYLWGTSPPTISITPATAAVSSTSPLNVELKPGRGTLKALNVVVLQGERPVSVLERQYVNREKQAKESFNVAKAGMKEGTFTLRVTAKSNLFGIPGRSNTISQVLTLDNTPPSVAVLSTAHNIIRGGSALVTYTINEDVGRTGVVFGDRFFPGYKQKGEIYACLFPFPYDMDQEHYIPRVIAVDKAGNQRSAGINFHLIFKPFTTDRLNLSDSFLEKIAAEFKNRFPEIQKPLEVFLKANGELRRQNVASLYDYGRQTSPTPLWQGVFIRMPNAAPLGGFAQTRIYMYHGEKVDQQTHLGFDLASLVHSPVPSANSGTVVLAGDLGIYGECVIIDHGLGLQTLYGHLSRMLVKGGDKVDKGQIIGHTGATGMAAGDHLHFGVVVSGQEVNPVEWWDASWIKNNVTDKLNQAMGSQGR